MNHYTNLESGLSLDRTKLEITAEYDGGKFLVIVEYTEDQLLKKYKGEFEVQKKVASETREQPAEYGPSGEHLTLREWVNQFMDAVRAEYLFCKAGVEENNLTIIEP